MARIAHRTGATRLPLAPHMKRHAQPTRPMDHAATHRAVAPRASRCTAPMRVSSMHTMHTHPRTRLHAHTPMHKHARCRIDDQIRKLDEQLVKYKDQIKKARPGPAQDAIKRRALQVPPGGMATHAWWFACVCVCAHALQVAPGIAGAAGAEAAAHTPSVQHMDVHMYTHGSFALTCAHVRCINYGCLYMHGVGAHGCACAPYSTITYMRSYATMGAHGCAWPRYGCACAPARNQLPAFGGVSQVLKQKRLFESQREQLYGQQFNVEQTRFTVDSIKDTVTTVQVRSGRMGCRDAVRCRDKGNHWRAYIRQGAPQHERAASRAPCTRLP